MTSLQHHNRASFRCEILLGGAHDVLGRHGVHLGEKRLDNRDITRERHKARQRTGHGQLVRLLVLMALVLTIVWSIMKGFGLLLGTQANG